MEEFKDMRSLVDYLNKTAHAYYVLDEPLISDAEWDALYNRLLAMEQEKASAAEAQQRRAQVGSGDRSERIRTYNFPQSRVTDHRIGLTLYKLEEILAGSLDQLIDPLIAADRAAQLQQQNAD